MRLWFRNVSFLLLIGCVLQILGILGKDIYRVFAFLSFLIFISTFATCLRLTRKARLQEAAAAFLIAVAGAVIAHFAPLGSFYLYLFLTAALYTLLSKQHDPEILNLRTYIIAMAGIVLMSELIRILPVLWHVKSGVASMLSHLAGAIAREDRNLGPTAMGLPLLGSLMVLALVRQGWTERRKVFHLAVILFLLWLVHIFYLVILKFYARWISNYHPHWEWLLLNSQHLFLVLGATVYTLLDRRKWTRPTNIAANRRTLLASLAALAAGTIAAVAIGWAPAPKPEPARIMIYDAGYLNWLTPVHGKYGERSAGMFGMLPSTLEAVGFHVIVSDDLGLLSQRDPPDCLITINIQEYLDDENKKRIWDYIANGGGLLCLGDHTGVAGIRGPFNDLLKPVGIRYRFDSSTFFGNGWNDALEYRNHPLNRGVTSAEDFQIWVGATLDLDIKARPVIVGRYGYSDFGNPANIQRSYLGDRSYNPDELLGDVVLVADARYGKGKVMIFGDTSGYQNLSLARTIDSVARSLHFLAEDRGSAPGVPTQLTWLFLILGFLLLSVAYSKSILPLVALSAGLGAGSMIMVTATPSPAQLTPRFIESRPNILFSPIPRTGRALAILDCSHGGRFTLHAWQDQSIGGLQLNLARNGYFLLIRDKFPYKDLKEAKLLLILSPCRGYSQKEIASIEKFMINGGHVIVCVGFEELDGSKKLLEHFGFSIANIPLGRFIVQMETDSLRMEFHEGWPVRFDERVPVEVLFSQWDQPLILKRIIGKGELIVIGDSSFFHDINLESRDRYLAGNIAFLRNLTERWREK